jgi:hypothetical protein
MDVGDRPERPLHKIRSLLILLMVEDRALTQRAQSSDPSGSAAVLPILDQVVHDGGLCERRGVAKG